MLVNIRGNGGSGKSTLARRLLDFPHKLIYGACGPKRPEAYQITAPGISRPIFLLGPYQTDCGGCDAIQPYDLLLELLQQYCKRGHVVFEGVLISDCYGQIGGLLSHLDSIVLFLDTPLEVCIQRIQGRRERKGNHKPFNVKNTTGRHKAIQRVKAKMEANGQRVQEVSSENGFEVMMGLLHD